MTGVSLQHISQVPAVPLPLPPSAQPHLGCLSAATGLTAGMGSSQQHPGSLDPAAPLAVDAAALLQQVAASHQQQAGMDAGQEAGRGGAAAPAAPPRAGNRPARAASEPRPATSYNARHQQVWRGRGPGGGGRGGGPAGRQAGAGTTAPPRLVSGPVT